MSSRTGFVWTPRYIEHDTGPGHPERPDRARALYRYFDETGLLDALQLVEPRPAELEHVHRVHDLAYVERFRAACTEGAESIDTPECPVCPPSFEIARLAAGAPLTAVDAVMSGTLRNAFCAVRPPGHHAERDFAMGFCYFNNIAVAAEYLRARHGVDRVAILDWDVHHCNGTQHHFESDPNVLVCSVHQHPHTLFPGTGFEYEKGHGEAVGATVNAPLMPGSGDDDYKRVFETRLLPAITAFQPGFLLVSAGFDPHRDDPLAQIDLKTEAFAWMTRQAVCLADSLCAGRLVTLLEGGYNLHSLVESARVHVEQLAGLGSAVE